MDDEQLKALIADSMLIWLAIAADILLRER